MFTSSSSLPWTQRSGRSPHQDQARNRRVARPLAQSQSTVKVLASKAGVLLEAALRELCLLYKCKMPFNAEGQHTLGEYLNGIDSKLGKLMKCVTNTSGASASTVSQTTTDILPLLEADRLASLDSESSRRTLQLGWHEPHGHSDRRIRKIHLRFARHLICLQCGELPRKNTSSFFSCGCKARELHPLTSPGAQPAQTGN